MNRLSSAKEFALSPFSFGKILRAIGLRRRPPDCKTDRKQGKKLYIRTKQKALPCFETQKGRGGWYYFLRVGTLWCCWHL